MKIIVMGTGPFAVPTCKRLLADGHEIPLVVTRPLASPAPKKIPSRPVFDWATDENITIFEPQSINDAAAIDTLKEQDADLLFVCDYGQILSSECLSAARLGGINLHGSILPRHRGAAPVQWALLRGDRTAGVTVIHMTPGLDAGPALAIAKTEIEPHETAAELEPRLAEHGVAATVEAISLLSGWDQSSPIGTIQDKSLVTKARRFAKLDGQLDFRLPAAYLVRLVRACQPWPGTYAELEWPGGKRVRMIVRAARSLLELPSLERTAPGSTMMLPAEQLPTDLQIDGQQLIAVRSSDGIFLLLRVQPAGKREMDSQEFLRGHPLKVGSRFLLPATPARLLSPKQS